MDILDPGQQASNPGVIPIQEQMEGGYEYRGYAYQQLAGLETRRQATGAPVLSEYIHPPGSGVEIFLRASKYGHLIRITESEGGFICHPRDNTNPGGAKPGGVAITPTYQYPLVDDDHGSRVLVYEKDAWAVTSEVENYGNLDWMGPDGDVVSWRGPCGRQFAMDDTESYPGFTEWDYTTISGGVETEHYTPYRNLVYMGGEVCKEFLSGYKVLGCALRGGALIVVVGVDYAGRTNPDGATGGFFDEIWLGDTRIGWQHSARPDTPWFFNPSGSEAVHGNQKLTIEENGTCRFTALSAGNGTQKTVIPPDRSTWSVTRQGSWGMHRDYSDGEKSITLSLNSTESSSTASESTETYNELPVMISGDPPTALTVSGPDAAVVGSQFTYTLTGGEGFAGCADSVVEWLFAGGTINDSGVITEITGCGTSTVTAILSGGGFTLSGSKQTRLPDGIWVEISNEFNSESPCNTYYQTDCVVGVLKYVEHWCAHMAATTETCSGSCVVQNGFECLNTDPHWDSICIPRDTIEQYGLTSGVICPDGTRCDRTFDRPYCASVRQRWIYEWVCP